MFDLHLYSRETVRLLRRLALGGLLFLLLPAGVVAQDAARRWYRPNVLKTNLLAPVSLFYERALTQRFALRTSARWWPESIVAGGGRFVNATLEGKFYTARLSRLRAGVHPAGFFVSPSLKGRILRYVDRLGTGPGKTLVLDEKDVRSLGYGLTIGYQWVIRQRWVLEAAHGLGFLPPGLTSYRHTLRYGTVTSDSANEYLRFDFRTGLSIGFTF